MWIFGYGSLMWDNWEAQFNCQRRSKADLDGYVRILNKASVEKWGTPQHPGPTLNIVASVGARCRGFAFQFADDGREQVTEYLRKREGGFTLAERSARLSDGSLITATVPIYERGKNLIPDRTTDQIAAMILAARGTSGACSDYVRNVADQLTKLGVEDPRVTELVTAINTPPT